MNLVMKTWKKGIGFFLALACIIALLPAQTAYAAPVTNPMTLQVKQRFTQPAGSSANEQVSYTLMAKNSSQPMPTGSSGGVYTFTISGTDDNSLPVISFPGYGIYEYELRQTTAAAPGYTYDSEVYTITVYYEATYMEMITTNSAGKKVTEIEFSHAYAPLPTDPKLMTYPPVKLTVQGNPDRADTFTFMLTEQGATGVRKLAAQGKAAPGGQTLAMTSMAAFPTVQALANPMPDGSVNGTKTVSITGSGETSFGEWSYDKAGTYYYEVTQVDTGLKGYTYDMAVYTIIDTVKPVDGQLVLDRVVTNDAGKAVQTCLYINKYTEPMDGKMPDTDGNKPGTDGNKPGTDGNKPGTDGNKPGTDGNRPGSTGPKTGDDTKAGLYQLRLGGGGAVFLCCAVYLLKKRKCEQTEG